MAAHCGASEYIMISDPNFRKITHEAKLPGKIALSEHWTVELKAEESGTRGEVKPEPLGGIKMRWEGTPKRVRLSQYLNVSDAEEAIDLDFEITLLVETTAAHPGIIQWVAIVKDTDAGEVFHTLFDISGSAEDDDWTVFARATAVRLGKERYRLCIQFDSNPKELVLRSVRGRVEQHDADANVELQPVAEAELPHEAGDAPAAASPNIVDVRSERAEAAEPVANPAKKLLLRLLNRMTKNGQVAAHRPPAPKKAGGKAEAIDKNKAGGQQTQQVQCAALATAAGRPKAVIIAWDMTHNPVGRAYLLADMLSRDFDVVLVGPMFKRYGSAVWLPVRSSKIEHRAFAAESLTDFAKSAVEFLDNVEADLVIACKPRMPSVLLALLLKHRLGCPILLDVDDHELSFFNDAAPMSLRDALMAFETEPEAAEQPYGEVWTRLTESLIESFDARIVSNVTLQRRFKGTIVRHARDEHVFGPNPRSRARVRAEFGYSESDKVVLFLGTPRAHKGIFRIADALRRIQNDDLVLCVIGDPKDKRVAAQLSSYDDVRIDVFPDQPWARLAELTRLADCVCLLQDETSPIAQYQIPAKLTDALATGVPVAVTDIPPVADIPPEILTVVQSDDDLDAFLEAVAEGSTPADFVERARDYFIGELSYATNRARLTALMSQTQQQSARWRKEWSDLLELVSDLSGSTLPIATPSWSETRTWFPAISRERPYDIAFFWKQNDTGIYGRRHDMMLKYLAQHPRIGRIIQFDAPMDIRQLHATARGDPDSHLDQANLVVQQTIRRFLRTADTRKTVRRVFIHRGSRREEAFLGQPLLRKDEYVDWVRAEIERADFTGPLLGWVTPVVFEYAAIHDQMNFSFSVADLIDDQRTFPSSTSRRRAIIESYGETLQRVDLVLANCEAAKTAFKEFRADIAVLPNAAEPHFPQVSDEKPEPLAMLPGPIIGYVGNLRDRVDVNLLERLALHDSRWQIVLIGSAHRDPEVLRVRKFPNVHFLGVVPYDDLPNYIGHFDVAVMPHLDNEISKAMNPLKLFVYASAGVPIVTTNVANISEVSSYAEVANSADEFIAAVQRLIGTPRQSRTLRPDLTWPARVAQAVELIDAAVHCVPIDICASETGDLDGEAPEPAVQVA